MGEGYKQGNFVHTIVFTAAPENRILLNFISDETKALRLNNFLQGGNSPNTTDRMSITLELGEGEAEGW